MKKKNKLYDLEKFCMYKVNSMMKPIIPHYCTLLTTIWYFMCTINITRHDY